MTEALCKSKVIRKASCLSSQLNPGCSDQSVVFGLVKFLSVLRTMLVTKVSFYLHCSVKYTQQPT